MRAYLDALPLCAVAVVAPLRVREFVIVQVTRNPAQLVQEIAARRRVAMRLAGARWCRDPGRAGMILWLCHEQWSAGGADLGDGCYALAAADALHAIEHTADECCEPREVLARARQQAEAAAALVERRMGEGAGMRDLNRGYKNYRLAETAAGNRALPYVQWIGQRKVDAVAKIAPTKTTT